jgi:hypothetical protein
MCYGAGYARAYLRAVRPIAFDFRHLSLVDPADRAVRVPIFGIWYKSFH